MFNRRLSPEYYVYWRRAGLPFTEDEDADELTSFGDGRSTAQFLEQFKKDERAMSAIRSIVKESRRLTRVSTFTPDQLLAEVARLILSGELGVALRPREYAVGQSSTPVAPSPIAPATGTPLTSAGGSEPDPATFSSDLNALAQAAALNAAAASGAPFCPT